jgi:hypothetical protein
MNVLHLDLIYGFFLNVLNFTFIYLFYVCQICILVKMHIDNN